MQGLAVGHMLLQRVHLRVKPALALVFTEVYVVSIGTMAVKALVQVCVHMSWHFTRREMRKRLIVGFSRILFSRYTTMPVSQPNILKANLFYLSTLSSWESGVETLTPVGSPNHPLLST